MSDDFKKDNDSDNKNKKDDEFQWKKLSKNGLVWVAVLFFALFFTRLWPDNSAMEYEVSYSKYMEFLNADKIASGEISLKEGEKIFSGVLKRKEFFGTDPANGIETEFFKTILPYVDESVIKTWEEKNIQFKFVEPEKEWGILFYNVVFPLLFIAILWVFIARRMQGGGTGGGRGLFSFGKSKARMLTPDKAKITFSDVAGADEAKMELQEIIEFLKFPQKFQKLGGKIPKGALLLGPPGTGKTLLAKAVAGEAGVPFFSMSGADFVEMFVGVGASRVRDLFEMGRKNAPCIIFIDEMDAVGRHRGAGLGGGHDEREQTLNQLLVEMDGFDTKEGVILIAATNRPDVLDAALLRPGRFDRQIVVDRPDVRGRSGILKVHTKEVPLDDSVNIETLAKGTPGLSGADIANLVNEAALLAARRDKETVGMDDFEEAKDKIMMGMERKSMILSDEEKKTTAYHEAGHALVGKLVPESDPVHKVTIIPRGRALGLTWHLPDDDKHTHSKTYCESRLAVLFGGRVAEKLIFNEFTTGASNDLERATSLARKMVCEWGMSEKLGAVTYGQKEQEIFLGREISQHRDFSDKIAYEIDVEVNRIISETEEKTEKLLKDNLDKLHDLTNALLEHELLDGEQIDMILRGEKIDAAAFTSPANGNKENGKDATKSDGTEEEKGESENPETK
ncbi:MAG: ATP-dependent metallopeptidase FtsH/Yme1/Tma family protein [Calditrichaeota bacterium]|nr:MAG: ATP-dependent metallopeptidase FtsH/Yme1/Tma family protein [Calditrichota bacterium]MBL1207596.1 ATP-dependent metallopeptidase FtsH/Yme1/Tma family protein [Calditrichota bacterium]NOG47429.1 ATP-dependent metallopeptidase FtsH/Yme1/Tma family protein [Calditrichota bacterium]